MKKFIFSLTLLIFVLNSFCQTTTNTVLTKDYYLQKSKKQKTSAWVLLGGGLGLAALGGIVQLIHENKRNNGFDFDFTGAKIAIGGGAIALASIPFFISSSNNKKKAASIAITNQNIFLPQQNSFASMTQKTLTLKIGL
ncbi:MAG: hypothetical protein ABIR03_10740 [Ginsengibacter sp.]